MKIIAQFYNKTENSKYNKKFLKNYVHLKVAIIVSNHRFL